MVHAQALYPTEPGPARPLDISIHRFRWGSPVAVTCDEWLQASNDLGAAFSRHALEQREGFGSRFETRAEAVKALANTTTLRMLLTCCAGAVWLGRA